MVRFEGAQAGLGRHCIPPIGSGDIVSSVPSLSRLGLSTGLEIVWEDLLEKYREPSDASVVDPLNFVARQVLGSVT